MRAVLASMELDLLPDRAFRISAVRNVSFLYVFGEQQLGALAVSPEGADFVPGYRSSAVLLDFWADDPFTDVVEPGATFTIWYGGDIGRGVVHTLR